MVHHFHLLCRKITPSLNTICIRHTWQNNIVYITQPTTYIFALQLHTHLTSSASHCQESWQAPAGGETAGRDKRDGVRKRTRAGRERSYVHHADRNIFSSPCFHSPQTNHLTKACASVRRWSAFKTGSPRSWRCWCRTISFFQPITRSHGDIRWKCLFSFHRKLNKTLPKCVSAEPWRLLRMCTSCSSFTVSECFQLIPFLDGGVGWFDLVIYFIYLVLNTVIEIWKWKTTPGQALNQGEMKVFFSRSILVWSATFLDTCTWSDVQEAGVPGESNQTKVKGWDPDNLL